MGFSELSRCLTSALSLRLLARSVAWPEPFQYTLQAFLTCVRRLHRRQPDPPADTPTTHTDGSPVDAAWRIVLTPTVHATFSTYCGCQEADRRMPVGSGINIAVAVTIAG